MKKRLFIVLIAALAAFIPAGSSAQEAVLIDTVDIGLWPEFDEPAMLVIYRIKLADETSLPVQIAFRIPTRAGEPHAVADGLIGDKPYSLDVQGEWTVVSFTAEDLYLQLEYYDRTFDTTSNPRHYEYIWPGDYAVSSAVMNIKLPGDSTGVVISPSFGEGRTGEDGFLYYSANAGEHPAGDSFSISVDYRSGDSAQGWMVWGIGALGVVLIAWGGYRYLSASRASSKGSRRRSKPAASTAGAVKYCHNCGAAAQKGDRFCRNCGTELR